MLIWSNYDVWNAKIINKIYHIDKNTMTFYRNPPSKLQLCLLCVVVLTGGNWYFKRTSFWEWIWRTWSKAKTHTLWRKQDLVPMSHHKLFGFSNNNQFTHSSSFLLHLNGQISTTEKFKFSTSVVIVMGQWKWIIEDLCLTISQSAFTNVNQPPISPPGASLEIPVEVSAKDEF